jgi:adenylylsulfate kinase-like enzyme
MISSQAASEVWAGPRAGRAIVLITGIQEAGSSTVAQLLAERLPRAAPSNNQRALVNGSIIHD